MLLYVQDFLLMQEIHTKNDNFLIARASGHIFLFDMNNSPFLQRKRSADRSAFRVS